MKIKFNRYHGILRIFIVVGEWREPYREPYKVINELSAFASFIEVLILDEAYYNRIYGPDGILK